MDHGLDEVGTVSAIEGDGRAVYGRGLIVQEFARVACGCWESLWLFLARSKEPRSMRLVA